MTAEIGLLNKSAVALAADSAVTYRTTGNQKIYNSANKLFALTKHQPVGIMVFSNSEFSGIPWETIIKMYRKKLGKKKFDKLEDYAKDFWKFIEASKFTTEEEQKKRYLEYVENWYQDIFNSHNQLVKKEFERTGTSLTDAQTIELWGKTKEQFNNHFSAQSETNSLNQSPARFFSELHSEIEGDLETVINRIFEGLVTLIPDLHEYLKSIALTLLKKDYYVDNITSGVVFAGFGDAEIFPSLVSYLVDFIVKNKVRIYKSEQGEVSNANGCSIHAFAQNEMVHGFLLGINSELQTFSKNALAGELQKMRTTLSTLVPTGNATLQQAISNEEQRVMNDFNSALERYSLTYLIPIRSVIQALPKDELASVAEALVNLTSFKRKVTMNQSETVGGPIDVAVISKGEGFIWIKRKHYFDPKLNPSYISNLSNL